MYHSEMSVTNLLNEELQKQDYFKIVYILFTSLISYKDLKWKYYGVFFSHSNDI